MATFSHSKQAEQAVIKKVEENATSYFEYPVTATITAIISNKVTCDLTNESYAIHDTATGDTQFFEKQ
jgi:hypothetical protein